MLLTIHRSQSLVNPMTRATSRDRLACPQSSKGYDLSHMFMPVLLVNIFDDLITFEHLEYPDRYRAFGLVLDLRNAQITSHTVKGRHRLSLKHMKLTIQLLSLALGRSGSGCCAHN